MFLTNVTANHDQIPKEAGAAEKVTSILMVKEGPLEKEKTVEALVRTYFADIPILADVAYCESKFKQTGPDNQVLRGELTPADLGVMQINEYFHGERAKKLGFDLHTLEGNLGYARFLYGKEGTVPWNASAHCWKDAENHLALK